MGKSLLFLYPGKTNYGKYWSEEKDAAQDSGVDL